jgi:hypothetical protein
MCPSLHDPKAGATGTTTVVSTQDSTASQTVRPSVTADVYAGARACCERRDPCHTAEGGGKAAPQQGRRRLRHRRQRCARLDGRRRRGCRRQSSEAWHRGHARQQARALPGGCERSAAVCSGWQRRRRRPSRVHDGVSKAAYAADMTGRNPRQMHGVPACHLLVLCALRTV